MNRALGRWSLVLASLFVASAFLAAPIAWAAPPGAERSPGHDRICSTLGALCEEPGVIYVGPAAAGRALDLLGDRFELVPLDLETPSDLQPLGHLVVGVADLENATLARLLRRSHGAGFVAGVTESLPAEVDRLVRGLGSASCNSGESARSLSLVGFQRTAGSFPGQQSGFVYDVQDGLGSDPEEQEGFDDRDRDFLAGRFGAEPPVPVGVGSDNDCPSTANCLVELALATTCTLYVHESIPTVSNSVQWEITDAIWSFRSFDNQEDLYFVAQDLEMTLAKPGTYDGFEERVASSLSLTAPVPQLISPSPGTTVSTTTYTSGMQRSFGGSVGTLSGNPSANLTTGVEISNSTTTSVPETTIQDASDIQVGRTKWQYVVRSKTETSTSFVNYWIWSYPRSAYGSRQTNFSFSSSATLLYPIASQDTANVGSGSLFSKAPLPFDTWTPAQPTVVNLTQNGQPVTSVQAGQSVVINGMGFYPSTVQDVLLGGEVVNMPSVASDTAISIVAPGSGIPLGTPLSVVVRTTQGFSNADVTLTVEANP